MRSSFLRVLTLPHVYLLLFLAPVISSQALCTCNQPDSEFATGVNLIYYKCNNDTPSTIVYPMATPQDMINVLDKNKRTIFFIFGYLQSKNDIHVDILMKALCHGNTDNIVLLDWSKYSIGFYPIVFTHIEKVGSLFAHSLRLLVDVGLDSSKIYLIGHSLGAHIAGFPGKCNSFTIPRITGLDPANRLFYPIGCYLTSKDAAWIDVIHTDMGGWGTAESMGTAEYYANKGTRPQPNCKLLDVPSSQGDVCSHQRSVVLYAESKLHCDDFMAIKCSNHVFFHLNFCKNNAETGIGYMASNVTGSYYFNTVGYAV